MVESNKVMVSHYRIDFITSRGYNTVHSRIYFLNNFLNASVSN